MKNKLTQLWRRYFFPVTVEVEYRQLVYSEVTCLECKEVLVSHSTHDYNTCSCPNEVMVDGGLSYLRYGAKDLDKIEVFSVYDDDDYKFVRRYAARGGRGIDGREPFSWTKIKDMNDDWLLAVLAFYPEGTDNSHLRIIKKEIHFRNKYRKNGKDL